MAKLTGKQIQDCARQIVKESPGGIRYAELVRLIHAKNPETPLNTIHGSVWDLGIQYPDEISKPSRGLFMPTVFASQPVIEKNLVHKRVPSQLPEEKFYEPFAEWLKNDLDEATVAVALGGATLQKKWGTPDVVGVYKPQAADRIKFDLEIIAAEIKADPREPVVAFGQAAAYRLFAAKSYVVMPTSISQEDYARLEALCMLYGIGLVVFETKPSEPNFTIRVRAQRFSPDMFFVNQFAERIYQAQPGVFNELFA